MSLVVETGSGVAGAESYAAVSDGDTRATNLGNTAWPALSTAQKETALRLATNYMEQAFRERWLGRRNLFTQSLSWPRWGVMVDGFPVYATVVPQEVKNACIDLAFKSIAGDLNADLTQGIVTKKVGPIETQYDRWSPQSVRYPSIEMMLAPFLKAGSSQAMLQRA